jgi:DNA polymerase
MPDPSDMTAEQLSRQARQHLDSLKAAGVDWLPAAPAWSPKTVPVDPRPQETGTPAMLFAQAGAGSDSPLTLEMRCQELKILAEKVSKCTRCAELASTRTQTVFGVGKIGAELCFVGEAPGADEDRQGEPFVGPAGQLLNKIIGACGMKREEVYICNILRCRPPGNRQPLPDEAGHCREYLERQLELVGPKFICALGACAAQNLLGSTQSIGRLRGRFHEWNAVTVMCTYHPAYILRTPSSKKDVWEDMKKLMARMGRAVPRSSG